MVRNVGYALLTIVMMLVAAGCASQTEWVTWKEHPTHFASGDHLSFSVRNSEGSAPHVSRRDITEATTEAWWGQPITVNTAQILER